MRMPTIVTQIFRFRLVVWSLAFGRAFFTEAFGFRGWGCANQMAVRVSQGISFVRIWPIIGFRWFSFWVRVGGQKNI